MYKKMPIGLVLLLAITLILPACRSATVSKTVDCADKDMLCIGMVTGLGGIKDQSYNQMAWEGILKAQAEKVADRVQYIETIDSKDYEANIATLVKAGVDVIVTARDPLNEATATAAKMYPDTLFIGIDQAQVDPLPNLVGLVFHEDQAGFQAGALAALLSRTKTIAAVLGPERDPGVKVIKEGFEAGAQYINPLIEIITTYYPDTSEMALADPRWAAITAAQSILDGADIVFDAGDLTGNGALIETASHPGLYCIGVEGDLWETLQEAHPCLVSSTVDNITQGVFDLVKLAKGGTFPTGNYFGASSLAPYHDFDAQVPQMVRDEMNQIATGLTSGSLVTGINQP